jgi:hypothetical protein
MTNWIRKLHKTEIHRCQVGWLGWPIHIKSDLTLSVKQGGTPHCWKQALSSNGAVFSCTVGIKKSCNSLRHERKLIYPMLVLLSKSVRCSNYQPSYSTFFLVYSHGTPYNRSGLLLRRCTVHIQTQLLATTNDISLSFHITFYPVVSPFKSTPTHSSPLSSNLNSF